MAVRLLEAQLSIRISAEDLGRVTEVAHASGATVAQFVREAVSDKCGEVEKDRSEAADADFAGDDFPSDDHTLTRSERLMLAAVTRHAAISSIAAASRAAGLSWSAAKAALDSLARRGAVRQRTYTHSWRNGVRERSVWEPVMSLPCWQRFQAQAQHVRLPVPAEPGNFTGPVPPQFWSLLWNHPDPPSLTIPADAEFVANRLLNGPSPHAALWASARLSVDALQACLKLRSTKPHIRDLINNALAWRATAPL